MSIQIFISIWRERFCCLMSSSDGAAIDQTSYGCWVEENSVVLSSLQKSGSVPVGFTREYRVLTEVCGSMRSGFLLLNQRAQVAYSNASAIRLLQLGVGNSETLRDFSVHQHLVSLAADSHLADSELEQLWHCPEQESSLDLALADAVVRWLRVRCFPVRSVQGG